MALGWSSCAQRPTPSAPVLDGRVGERIALPAGAVLELIAPYPGTRLLTHRRRQSALARAGHLAATSLSDYLREHARPISYGYLNASFPISAYQTIFALHPGSAEMPSAARPFSAELVARLGGPGRDLRAYHLAHRLVLPRRGRGSAA